MRQSLRSPLALLLATACLFSPLIAYAGGQGGAASEKGGKTSNRKNVAKPKGPNVADQIQLLQQQLKKQQDMIEGQQGQIQQLQQNNAQLQQQVQQQGQSLQGSVQQATQQAAAVQQDVKDLHSTVSTLQSDTKLQASALAETKKSVSSLESPLAIHYKGVNLYPGGWVESTFLVRGRNENADITSNFGAVPFERVANANLTEFRASARGSRAILAADGMAGSTKLTGYMELDFLGQAPTANQVETNSFSPRQRQLWGQAEFKNGITVTGGQFWSLITTDRKGIATRAEFIPTTIEGSYVVGYTYVRQNSIRINKNFSNKAWAAFEIDNSETTLGTSYTPDNLYGFNNSANALSPNGSTLNYLAGSTNGFSTNLMPDFVGKVVFEPGWGHYELKGLARVFRDRINGNNNKSFGGGVGWAAILPVKPKKVDFIFEGLVGKGIGRYGAANQPDVTIKPNGEITPLPAVHALAGLEFHPQPKLDVFVYVGDEYVGAERYVTDTGKPGGYGSHLVNNTYCQTEVVPTGKPACGAQNKNIYDVTGGFWYRIWKGPFGTFQFGSQFAFIHRTAWAGIGGAPTGNDPVGMTSLRFYLP